MNKKIFCCIGVWCGLVHAMQDQQAGESVTSLGELLAKMTAHMIRKAAFSDEEGARMVKILKGGYGVYERQKNYVAERKDDDAEPVHAPLYDTPYYKDTSGEGVVVDAALRSDGRAGFKGEQSEVIRSDFERVLSNRLRELEEVDAERIPSAIRERLRGISSVWQQRMLAAWIQGNLLNDHEGLRVLHRYLATEKDDVAKKRLTSLMSELKSHDSGLFIQIYKELYKDMPKEDLFFPGKKREILYPPERLMLKRRRLFESSQDE